MGKKNDTKTKEKEEEKVEPTTTAAPTAKEDSAATTASTPSEEDSGNLKPPPKEDGADDADRLLQASKRLAEIVSRYELTPEDQSAVAAAMETIESVAANLQSSHEGPRNRVHRRASRRSSELGIMSIPKPKNGTLFECEEAMEHLAKAQGRGEKIGEYISAWLSMEPRAIPVERRYCYDLLKRYKEGRPVCWRRKSVDGSKLLAKFKGSALGSPDSNAQQEGVDDSAAALATLAAASDKQPPATLPRREPLRGKKNKNPTIPRPRNGTLFECDEAMELLWRAPLQGATASDYIKAWLAEEPPLVPVSRRQCYLLLQKYKYRLPVRWGLSSLGEDTSLGGEKVSPSCKPGEVARRRPTLMFKYKQNEFPKPSDGKPVFDCVEAMQHLVDAKMQGASASDYITAWINHDPPLVPCQRRHCYNLLKKYREGEPVSWGKDMNETGGTPGAKRKSVVLTEEILAQAVDHNKGETEEEANKRLKTDTNVAEV